VSELKRGRGDSVGDQVAAAHRRLDALFDETLGALRDGPSPEAAHEAFTRLREALEAHFDQEDRLYYPALWGLRPQLKPPLEALVRAHEGFRAQLAAFDAALTAGRVEEAAGKLSDLAEGFSRHEAEEEELLCSLDRELQQPQPAA
jgi:hypothetical protein